MNRIKLALFKLSIISLFFFYSCEQVNNQNNINPILIHASNELVPESITSNVIYYINPSASGNGDGSNWTNAFTAIPDNLERGAIYYVADGNYGSVTFDDDAHGEKYIYLKKATLSDHGTNTGWSSEFGDGYAQRNLITLY